MAKFFYSQQWPRWSDDIYVARVVTLQDLFRYRSYYKYHSTFTQSGHHADLTAFTLQANTGHLVGVTAFTLQEMLRFSYYAANMLRCRS